MTVAVSTTAFSFTKGEPKSYAVKLTSGRTIYREFCASCGLNVGDRVDALSDLRSITAGSLDDPSGLEPQADIWTSSAQPWDDMNPALPKYEHSSIDEQMLEIMVARR